MEENFLKPLKFWDYGQRNFYEVNFYRKLRDKKFFLKKAFGDKIFKLGGYRNRVKRPKF